jgi:hypothetical protein
VGKSLPQSFITTPKNDSLLQKFLEQYINTLLSAKRDVRSNPVQPFETKLVLSICLIYLSIENVKQIIDNRQANNAYVAERFRWTID